MIQKIALVSTLSILTTFLASAGAVQAQTAKPLGQFKDWGAYVAEAGGGKVCYVLSQPKSTAPDNVNRDPVYFFVTTRPGQGVKNEVSVVVGYPYQEESKASAVVGSDSFTLFTKDDGAWVENAAEEARLVAAMRAGATMQVKGTSSRGTETVDSYSLSGISAALDRIAIECK
ncbi:invasion associated locus B family protein [Microbaculum marinum]|uniref:Invasion associated locus B family protein n=1 Tax=Microbaculum marinum TaxID=1764581 RepID=A0AAW9S0U8_9HYPH